MLAKAVGFVAIAALALLVREARLPAFRAHQQNQRYEDLYYLPPAGWLPLLSLGFRDALADLVWCKSLVYFGEEIVRQRGVKYAFDYSDAVIALSPDFKSAYRWAATVAVYRPQGADLREGMRGAKYLERAIERWPNDGELHWEYGSLLRFELAPMVPEGPEKDRLLALAAPHLAIAASLGAGPAWLALNSSALLDRLGQTEQAIHHMEEVYGTVQDERAKQIIEERLASLRSQAFVEALRTANQEFERSRRESYPYLSPSLFMLVGERVERRWLERTAQRFLEPLVDDTGSDVEPDEP